MPKAKGKSGGSSSKSCSHGGKASSKSRSRKLQTTTHEHMLAIRKALFHDDGSDRDVLKDFKVRYCFELIVVDLHRSVTS
jgi:hypothetical protein